MGQPCRVGSSFCALSLSGVWPVGHGLGARATCHVGAAHMAVREQGEECTSAGEGYVFGVI